MREEGYIPLVTVGVIFLFLISGILGYVEWARHETEMARTSIQEGGSVSFEADSRVYNLESLMEESMNRAFWRYGRVDNGGLDRVSKVENEVRGDLVDGFEMFFSSFDKEYDGEGLDFKVKGSQDGRPVGLVEFSENIFVEANSLDNSTSVRYPLEELEKVIGPRFFLLENRMDDFEEDLHEFGLRWMFMEYVFAYYQAWIEGDLDFCERRSESLFRLALASYEMEKFGSADYGAFLEGFEEYLPLEIFSEESFEDFDQVFSADKFEDFRASLEEALNFLERSSRKLGEAVDEFERLNNFNPETRFSDLERELSGLQENSARDFERIATETLNVYDYPDEVLEDTLNSLRYSRELLEKSKESFERGLERLKSSEDKLAESFHEDLHEGEPRGVADQVLGGFDTILKDFEDFEEDLLNLSSVLPKSSDYEGIFPSDFVEDFSKDLNSEDFEDLVKAAENNASLAFSEFLKDFEKVESELENFGKVLQDFANLQLGEPEPNYVKEFDSYPGPDENFDEGVESDIVEKFVIFEGQGTIAGVMVLLEGMIEDFKDLEELGKDFSSEMPDLESFDFSDPLIDELSRAGSEFSGSNLSRMEHYSISPPVPLNDDPGISVFQDMQIGKVEVERLDPAGLIDSNAPPTPVYLWFLKTTIYWGLWNVSITLEEPLVQKIFDYTNQTVSLPKFEGSADYVHKPMRYGREFEEKEFSFNLVVVSLKSFNIA